MNDVYLVQVKVQNEGEVSRWIPMYQVCYSLKEAQAKAATKKYFQTRVVKYTPVETYSDPHSSFPDHDFRQGSGQSLKGKTK